MRRGALLIGPVLVLAGAAPASAAEVNVAGLDTLVWDKPQVTINVGDTVTWTFEGTTQAHNVRSSSDNWEAPLASPIGAPAPPASFTFTKAGTFRYLCEVHPDTMVGDVIVGEATPPPPPPPLSEQPFPSDMPAPAVFETGGLDETDPVLSRVRVQRSGSGASVRFALSEQGRVQVRLRRGDKTVKVRQVRASGDGKLSVRRLKAGRYRIEVRAWDIAGNAAPAVTRTLRIR